MMESEVLKVRVNPMQISSLTAFASLSGRCRNDQKDAYFVRYIGYEDEKKYIEEISAADKRLESADRSGRGGYFRSGKLEFRPDPQEAARYAAAYDRMQEAVRDGSVAEAESSGAAGWSGESPSGNCWHRNGSGDENCLARVTERLLNKPYARSAFDGALKLYAASGNGISQSMIRNFGIKLLFWCDAYLPGLFPDRTAAGMFPKFILSGDIKVQEYLFLYFLVHLGCDVLYLNPERDAAVSPALLAQSSLCGEEKRGPVRIPPYEPGVERDRGPSASVSGGASAPAASAQGASGEKAGAWSANSGTSSGPGGGTRGGSDSGAGGAFGAGCGDPAAGVGVAGSAGADAAGNTGGVRLDASRLMRPPSKNKRSGAATGSQAGNAAPSGTQPSGVRTGGGSAPSGTQPSGIRPGEGTGAGGAGNGGARRPGQGGGPPSAGGGTAGVSGGAAAGGGISRGTGAASGLAAGRRQLEYEELAQLSPGIVMISVFDKTGKCFKTGSGVVISEKGYILTNFHVACEGAYYGIRFEEEDRPYETDELIKYNQFHDLAIIRIERRCTPISVYRGEKELVRGQKVVAIGSPLGLFNSVSDGIISGFRMIDETSMIQFTAPISHGSSGGALLNLYGELVGIITAGFDDGQNINLAVDYKTVRSFASGFL